MKKDTLGVALVKEACPVCAKLFDGPIILNTRLTEKEATKVKDMHGKTIGFMDKPCAECQEFMKQGVILVTIRPPQTEEEKHNPYRTGGFFVLKDDAVKRIFEEDAEPLLEKRVGFITDAVAEAIGLVCANGEAGL